MLLLSVFPCKDKVEYPAQERTTISSAKEHQRYSDETEHCTPFCTCSCCAITASTQNVPNYGIYKKVFQKAVYPAYLAPACAELSYSIWQPPQLS